MSKSSNPYSRLSIGAKQAAHRDRQREPSISCPHCETQTTAADLIRHVETSCSGHREPHALSRWVTWAEAIALGVPPKTLSRWAARRRVQVRATGEQRATVGRRGRPATRVYLYRDLAKMLANRFSVSSDTNPR